MTISEAGYDALKMASPRDLSEPLSFLASTYITFQHWTPKKWVQLLRFWVIQILTNFESELSLKNTLGGVTWVKSERPVRMLELSPNFKKISRSFQSNSPLNCNNGEIL